MCLTSNGKSCPIFWQFVACHALNKCVYTYIRQNSLRVTCLLQYQSQTASACDTELETIEHHLTGLWSSTAGVYHFSWQALQITGTNLIKHININVWSHLEDFQEWYFMTSVGDNRSVKYQWSLYENLTEGMTIFSNED